LLKEGSHRFAASHGKLGIRCNSISPGLVLTENVVKNLPPALREIVEEETLTPYLGTPHDIACVAVLLASEESRYINGQNVVVDGGTSSHIPGFAQMRKLFSSPQE
jgi:NAD(P)-dependent dehydrogenase (short-subunit alcohol dehydrogenase family)